MNNPAAEMPKPEKELKEEKKEALFTSGEEMKSIQDLEKRIEENPGEILETLSKSKIKLEGGKEDKTVFEIIKEMRDNMDGDKIKLEAPEWVKNIAKNPDLICLIETIGRNAFYTGIKPDAIFDKDTVDSINKINSILYVFEPKYNEVAIPEEFDFKKEYFRDKTDSNIKTAENLKDVINNLEFKNEIIKHFVFTYINNNDISGLQMYLVQQQNGADQRIDFLKPSWDKTNKLRDGRLGSGTLQGIRNAAKLPMEIGFLEKVTPINAPTIPTNDVEDFNKKIFKYVINKDNYKNPDENLINDLAKHGITKLMLIKDGDGISATFELNNDENNFNKKTGSIPGLDNNFQVWQGIGEIEIQGDKVLFKNEKDNTNYMIVGDDGTIAYSDQKKEAIKDDKVVDNMVVDNMVVDKKADDPDNDFLNDPDNDFLKDYKELNSNEIVQNRDNDDLFYYGGKDAEKYLKRIEGLEFKNKKIQTMINYFLNIGDIISLQDYLIKQRGNKEDDKKALNYSADNVGDGILSEATITMINDVAKLDKERPFIRMAKADTKDIAIDAPDIKPDSAKNIDLSKIKNNWEKIARKVKREKKKNNEKKDDGKNDNIMADLGPTKLA